MLYLKVRLLESVSISRDIVPGSDICFHRVRISRNNCSSKLKNGGFEVVPPTVLKNQNYLKNIENS